MDDDPDVQMILTYVPEAENLTWQEALNLAHVRDALHAQDFYRSWLVNHG